MITQPTPDDVEPIGHDRRQFLQRAGLGAAAVGAWVAPQVLFTATAAAGCTPITKLLQVRACTCPGSSGAVTTTDGNLPGCVPSGWANGRNDGVGYTCTATAGNPCWGGSITILGTSCVPTAGRAVKWCRLASGTKFTCVTGAIVGSTITFPALSTQEQVTGCIYVDYRITVTCCT